MRFFNGLKKKPITQKQAQEEIEKGELKRAKIIATGSAMKRLISNPDWQILVDELEKDQEELNKNLLNEDIEINQDRRTRLIARINQIDRVIKKPGSLIWQMENLTEVRAAIQEKTKALVGQAHGNKTGGESNE